MDELPDWVLASAGLDIQRAYIKVGWVASDCNDESLSSSREVTSHISLKMEAFLSWNPNWVGFSHLFFQNGSRLRWQNSIRLLSS